MAVGELARADVARRAGHGAARGEAHVQEQLTPERPRLERVADGVRRVYRRRAVERHGRDEIPLVAREAPVEQHRRGRRRSDVPALRRERGADGLFEGVLRGVGEDALDLHRPGVEDDQQGQAGRRREQIGDGQRGIDPRRRHDVLEGLPRHRVRCGGRAVVVVVEENVHHADAVADVRAEERAGVGRVRSTSAAPRRADPEDGDRRVPGARGLKIVERDGARRPRGGDPGPRLVGQHGPSGGPVGPRGIGERRAGRTPVPGRRGVSRVARGERHEGEGEGARGQGLTGKMRMTRTVVPFESTTNSRWPVGS